MSVVAVGGFGIAAGFDLRTRRVPNLLWVALGTYAVFTTVTVSAAVASAYLGTAALVSYRVGEIGGADVKGLIVLPLLLPNHWFPATVIALGITALGFASGRRGEVPFFVPLLAGVVLALLLGLTINPLPLPFK